MFETLRPKPNPDDKRRAEMEAASIEAVRRGDASPTLEFAADNKEMRNELINNMAAMDDQDLAALYDGLLMLSKETDLKKRASVADFLSAKLPLLPDLATRFINFVAGRDLLPDAQSIQHGMAQDAVKLHERSKAVEEIFAALQDQHGMRRLDKAA